MDATRTICHLSFVLFLLVTFIREGLGLKCYICNSNIHSKCYKLKSLNETERGYYSAECGQLGDFNYTACRTIMQDVKGKTSIVRQCAKTGPTSGCKTRSGTRKIQMKYCYCNWDGCNSARQTQTTTPLAIVASLLTFYLMAK